MYIPQDYSHLLGMDGFSDKLLEMHFTLYQGYVRNTNILLELLQRLLDANRTSGPEYAEPKRRLGWEFDGMRLHEYYFDNLGGDGRISRKCPLIKKIKADFGSYDKWEQDFKATGMMRGIGWSVLYQDITNGQLINFWINEHDTGHPTGCKPLLIMDVWEHAYMPDYDLKRNDYIDAFFSNINWNVVQQRLEE
ncbi:Superoxide dismutase [Fe] [bioreactor metagenome]|uniref:superoxide dismutase n=1 Tax=bioreactor metagenome TaxID=1076179 RepID=A0A644VIX5_9ZZZZ